METLTKSKIKSLLADADLSKGDIAEIASYVMRFTHCTRIVTTNKRALRKTIPISQPLNTTENGYTYCTRIMHLAW